MSDETFAYLLFGIGFALMIASMILGPFGVTNWSIFTAGVACCCALAAASVGFLTWEEPGGPEGGEPFVEDETEKHPDVNK